jgi:hypothetical protein
MIFAKINDNLRKYVYDVGRVIDEFLMIWTFFEKQDSLSRAKLVILKYL